MGARAPVCVENADVDDDWGSTRCFSLFGNMFQNELAILEFIHMVVETMDQYFEGVVRSCACLVSTQFAFFFVCL